MFPDVLEEYSAPLSASAEVTPVNTQPADTTRPVPAKNYPVNTPPKSRGGIFLLALIAVLVLSILLAQYFTG